MTEAVDGDARLRQDDQSVDGDARFVRMTAGNAMLRLRRG